VVFGGRDVTTKVGNWCGGENEKRLGSVMLTRRSFGKGTLAGISHKPVIGGLGPCARPARLRCSITPISSRSAERIAG